MLLTILTSNETTFKFLIQSEIKLEWPTILTKINNFNEKQSQHMGIEGVTQVNDSTTKQISIYNPTSENLLVLIKMSKETKYFSINKQGIIILKPYEVLHFDVKYSPLEMGFHTAMISLKNNLTFIEHIYLSGQSGSGLLIVNDNQQSDTIMLTHQSCNILKTILVLKNTGNLSILVKNILFNDKSCAGYGFQIELDDCNYLILKPNDSYDLQVQYESDFSQSKLKNSLIFDTNIGKLEFSIQVEIPMNVLNNCLGILPSIDYEYYFYYLIMFILIILVLFTIAISIFQIKSIFKKFKAKVEIYQSQKQQQQHEQQYSQVPHERILKRKSLENSQESASPKVVKKKVAQKAHSVPLKFQKSQEEKSKPTQSIAKTKRSKQPKRPYEIDLIKQLDSKMKSTSSTANTTTATITNSNISSSTNPLQFNCIKNEHHEKNENDDDDYRDDDGLFASENSDDCDEGIIVDSALIRPPREHKDSVNSFKFSGDKDEILDSDELTERYLASNNRPGPIQRPTANKSPSTLQQEEQNDFYSRQLNWVHSSNGYQLFDQSNDLNSCIWRQSPLSSSYLSPSSWDYLNPNYLTSNFNNLLQSATSNSTENASNTDRTGVKYRSSHRQSMFDDLVPSNNNSILDYNSSNILTNYFNHEKHE